MSKVKCVKCGLVKDKGGRGLSFCPNDKSRMVSVPDDTKPKSEGNGRQFDFSKYQTPRRGGFNSARDRKPTFDELIKVSKWFDTDSYAYQTSYDRASRWDWGSVHERSDDEVRVNVIGFLNDWKAFGPRRFNIDPAVIGAIKSSHKGCLEYFESLNGETIQDIAFDQEKVVGGRSLTNSEIISTVFFKFFIIGNRFRDVAASKYLHMVNPDLFVMWDTEIANSYGAQKSPKGYTNTFLPLVKEKLNGAIEEAMKARNISREDAIAALQYRGKTLAKIIDEFNYKTFTRGV